jgi:hypothetical protein
MQEMMPTPAVHARGCARKQSRHIPPHNSNRALRTELYMRVTPNSLEKPYPAGLHVPTATGYTDAACPTPPPPGAPPSAG